MSVYITNEIEKEFDFNYEEKIIATVDEAKKLCGCEFDTAVNVLIVDDDEIHEMNRMYREIDRATDVLSFPLLDYDSPADFSFIENGDLDYFDPDTNELMLGDIVLSYDHILAQAAEYGHSVMRELMFLVAHSMLHLFGYDHMEDDEREVMEQKQKEIMESLGVTR